MTPELLSFVSFSAGVLISCTVFVFVLRGRVIIRRETALAFIRQQEGLQSLVDELEKKYPDTKPE